MLELNSYLFAEGRCPGPALVEYFPGFGFNNILDHLQNGGLPGPVGSQQSKTDTLLNSQADTLYRNHGLIMIYKVSYLK